MNRLLRELRPTLALAIPITIGQLTQVLIGLTDSLMIGQTGAVPLAASSFGVNVFGVFFVLGIGIMVPVSVMVAHARGASRPEECGEYLRHGVALALGTGLLETAILAVMATQLHRFGQPPEVLAIVKPVFLLIAGSLTPVLVYMAYRQYAEAMGRPWVPMVIMLADVVLNAGLNWALIYGHLGAPALGLTGSGISTLVARTLGTTALIFWVSRDPELRAALPKHWWAPLSRARLGEMLRLGLPAAGMLLFEAGAFAASAIMMGWLGAVPLAAHQIAISCASTTFMFFLGLALAVSMRISAAVGAGETERLRPIGYGALLADGLIALLFVGGYVLGGDAVAGWFVRDPAVIAVATQLLVVVAIFQVFDGTQVTAVALLRGMKDVRVPAVITFVAYWVVAIGGGYTLGVVRAHGAVAIWGSLAASLAFAAVFLTGRFQRLTRPARLGLR
jgi:MATE family multidrug resistance protein